MMPEKGSQGNLDPSRLRVRGGADIRVADRDDPTGLPDSADIDGWRNVAAGVVP